MGKNPFSLHFSPLAPMPTSINSLSMDALVQILCKLDHDELKQLLLISKFFSDAVLAARRLHFNFSTPPPTKKTATAFSWSPRSPVLKLQWRKPLQKPKLSKNKLRKIAVVLFPAGECKSSLNAKAKWANNYAHPTVRLSSANV